MLILSHYDYSNMGRIHTKYIINQNELLKLNDAFLNAGGTLVGFSAEYKNLTIHGLISSYELERLKRDFTDYIKCIRESIIANFKMWDCGCWDNSPLYKID